jgi:DNA (cytosine-5)-methyltransferase 1
MENKPRLLDLFCCAGGAGMGYHRAGFEVVGVDIEPQPHYPFPFILGDAIDILTRMLTGEKFQASDRRMYGWEDFDAAHASPPCQDYTRSYTPYDHGTAHLLPDVRKLLMKSGKTWVLENVPGAPMRADYLLCGCMFKLPRLRRKRIFETSWNGFALLPPCQHPDPIVTVVGHGIPSGSPYLGKVDGREYSRLARKAMGIDWMTRDELAQAIPPAYSEFIGKQIMNILMTHLEYSYA